MPRLPADPKSTPPSRRDTRGAGRARGPGRPRGTDADRRDALVDAARDLFAAQGFAATSLREVATHAGVTPALAYYYFRDKAGLLDAVVEERIAPLAARLGQAVAAAGPDPESALAAFVRAYTATAAANRWLPQLIMREVLQANGALREVLPQRVAGGMAAMLRGLVEAGQASGRFRRDLDPARAVMSVLSLCIFPFLAAPLVEGVLGISVDAAGADALAGHHLAVLLHGLEPRP